MAIFKLNFLKFKSDKNKIKLNLNLEIDKIRKFEFLKN